MWYGISTWDILNGIFDVQELPHGANIKYPLDFIFTSEDATQTDRVGEQDCDGRVVAASNDA